MDGKDGEKLNKAQTVEEIFSWAVEQIPRVCPGWTNYNPSDPGITLLEMFSWLKEIQDFHMEQTGKAHELEYLKLLGGRREGKKPGKAWITLDSREGTLLPGKTVFCGGDVIFETVEEQMAVEHNFAGFRCGEGPFAEEIAGEWLAEGRGICLYPFGKDLKHPGPFTVFLIRPLAAGVPFRLYLSLESGEKKAGEPKRIPVDEAEFDSHGFYPLAETILEFFNGKAWEKAEILEDETYGFLQEGTVRFRLPQAMDPEKPALRFVPGRYEYMVPPVLQRISLAMVLAVQKETVTEPLILYGNGLPGQVYPLEEPDLYEESLRLEAEDPEKKGQLKPWIRVEDFDGSKPWDRHYILENGVLRFGDSLHGLAPEGKIVLSQYERTKGEAGNLKAGTVKGPGFVNESGVSGGRDAQTVKEALKRRREELLKPFRAVTAEDYEELVKRIPGLLIKDCSAYVRPGAAHEITLAVRPWGAGEKGVLNDAYRRNIFRYLEERRMAGTRIVLKSPEYFSLTVSCEAMAKVSYRKASAITEKCIREWAEKFTFGEEISVSSLYGKIDALPCIRGIRSLYLDLGGLPGRETFRLPPWGFAVLGRVDCVLITES